MYRLIRFKRVTPTLVVSVLVCVGFTPLQAVSPAPDGGYPGGNTAEGQAALFSLTTGGFNTAVGFFSLRGNGAGNFNTAVGAGALIANIANENTATGVGALLSNTSGGSNTASGALALESNTTGDDNTAIGGTALQNNTTGFNNVALGSGAGANQTIGSNNVYIGFDVSGVAGENNACYIASIYGQQVGAGTGIPVLVDSNNKLGTAPSSERFKKDIAAMDKASEAILALRPVTFHYKTDKKGTAQFGLIAEEVAKVNPALVLPDKEGKPYTVRYDQVNAMLLNEFLKEHRKVEQQRRDFEAALAQQQKQIEVLTAGLQKVSAQLEVRKSTPQTVLNNR